MRLSASRGQELPGNPVLGARPPPARVSLRVPRSSSATRLLPGRSERGRQGPGESMRARGGGGDAVPSVGSGKPGSRPGMVPFGLPGCSNNTPTALPLSPERPGPPRYSSGPFTPRGSATAGAGHSSCRAVWRLYTEGLPPPPQKQTPDLGAQPRNQALPERRARSRGDPSSPSAPSLVRAGPTAAQAGRGRCARRSPRARGPERDLWFFRRGGLPKALRNPAGKYANRLQIKSAYCVPRALHYDGG